MRSDWERLLDIKESIERIQKYAERGRSEFDNDELIRTWVLHHLFILGEACGSVSEGLKKGHTDIPWADIVSHRNVLVHRYFGIDLDLVWDVVERELPALKTKIDAILEELGGES